MSVCFYYTFVSIPKLGAYHDLPQDDVCEGSEVGIQPFHLSDLYFLLGVPSQLEPGNK